MPPVQICVSIQIVAPEKVSGFDSPWQSEENNADWIFSELDWGAGVTPRIQKRICRWADDLDSLRTTEPGSNAVQLIISQPQLSDDNPEKSTWVYSLKKQAIEPLIHRKAPTTAT